MVANATMFSHLLPGCSCGRNKFATAINVNLVHAFLCNVCNAISYTTKDDRGSSVVEIQFTVSDYFHCVKNLRTILLPQN